MRDWFICVGMILCVLALALVSYQQGVIDERTKWQKVYMCVTDPQTGAVLCMKDAPVRIIINPDKKGK